MNSSTNRYLTALAIYDTLYLIFALTMSFNHYPTTSRLALYVLYRAYLGRTLTNICSNTGIWLTVTFTVERFIVVCCPMKGKIWCTPARTKHILVAVCLAATIVTLPEFCSRTVETRLDPVTNVTILEESTTEFGKQPSYLFGYQYINQALFTFLPLMLLSVFNTLLMRALITAAKQRDLMTNSRTCYPTANARSSSGGSQQLQDQHRITLMLICVVIVFIICQLPSAVAILYANFVRHSMTPEDRKIVLIANNVFNLLVMINSAVNFIFYSAFSSRFRATFRRVFCRRCMPAEAAYSYPDVISMPQGRRSITASPHGASSVNPSPRGATPRSAGSRDASPRSVRSRDLSPHNVGLLGVSKSNSCSRDVVTRARFADALTVSRDFV